MFADETPRFFVWDVHGVQLSALLKFLQGVKFVRVYKYIVSSKLGLRYQQHSS